ncbi:MAG: hypothetical protein EXS17_05695 [Phycisphaerales bacterium]|nr:hypothetical protein [Phycisphaerales bacterium]
MIVRARSNRSSRQTGLIPSIAACFAATVLWACGVSAPERLEVTSVGDTPRTFRADLGSGTYAVEQANVSMVLSDVTTTQLADAAGLFGQLLHVELMWEPLAGKTAIDPEATNLSIRLSIFSGHEMGLYGGGGFGWPSGTAGQDGHGEFGVDIVGSNLSLLASTPGFVDLLSPCQLSGRLRTKHDEAATRQLRRAASQYTSNALKRVQWVRSSTAATDAIDAIDALMVR